MARVPVIVTSSASNDDSSIHAPHYCLNKTYANAIVSAGGMPLLAIAHGQHDAFAKLVDIMDALLLPGGADVHPAHYNEELTDHTTETNAQRDELELALIRAARAKGVPILGICRGMQLLNIAYGGSLYQDIAQATETAITHDNSKHPNRGQHIAHTVSVEKGSLLSLLMEQENVPVNSTHHQSVKQLGMGLSVSARAPDGIIEAIEDPLHPFVLGIQWHPEGLQTDHTHAKEIFRAFVESARG